MRSLRLSAVALLAMGATGGFTATATAASAYTTLPVMFTGVTVSPNPISYGNTTVTIGGQLDEAVQQPGGTWVPGSPVANVPVAIQYQPPTGGVTAIETLKVVDTGSGGDFADTQTLPAGGAIIVSTSASPGHGYAGKTVYIQTSPRTPKVALNRQPKSLVWSGANLTFTGTATVSVDGAARPLAGAPVELYRNGVDMGVSAVTAANGTFGLPAANVTSGGQWTAKVSPAVPGNDSLYGAGTSNAVPVHVQYGTRIEDVSYPATAEAHRTEKLTGTVQASDGSRWIPASRLPVVTVYYRTSSTGAWIDSGNTLVGPGGTFATYTNLRPGTKQVQVRVPRQSIGDVYLASSGPVKTIKVYDETCLTGLGVGHFDGRTLVHGFVVDHCGAGAKDATFETVTGTAKIYYRKNAKARWTYLGSARLGHGGSVDYTHAGTIVGDFLIGYPGQGYFERSSSVPLYLG